MAERTNPHANLIIGAQDEATPVFEKIKASSQGMAEGVKQAAKQAGQALEGGMVASVKKTTEAMAQAKMSWREFLGANMGPAMKQFAADGASHAEAHTKAIRQIAEQWKAYKATGQAALSAVAAQSAGTAAATEKLNLTQQRLLDSLSKQATIAGQGKAAWLEMRAAQLGVADQAAVYITRLRQAEQAQAGVGGAIKKTAIEFDKYGLSVKQTSAAMRQVPAQFTDIITSLQGGQAPLTVFLQQGGQLKDLFGGAGNAARAFGGYVIGLVNPFTVAAAAVAGFGLAMASVNSKDAALLALSTQLAATGRASAGAVGEIKALVKELNLIPGVSKASATAIITEFAKVNGIGSDLFKSLGSSVADFAAATGTDLPTAAKKLADAFADPAKGAQALEGALGTLTAAQILTIEKMAAMGDKSGAQVAMMDALKQATEGLAKQGMTPLGEATDKMSNAWDALTSSIGNSEAFRTANSWLATLIEKVAELTVRLSQMKPPTWLQFLPVVGPAIGALTMAAGSGSGGRSSSGVVGEWNEGGATGSWGPTASETEQQVKAAIAATRGYETQAAAMEKLRGVASQAKDALKELESQNRGGSVEAMRLRDSIAAMNEKLADMGKKGAPKGPTKETISEYDKLIKKLSDELPKAAAEAEAAQMGYNKAQTEFLALAGSPAWASFSNSQRAVVASMFEGKIASEEAGEAAKALSKSYAEAAAERIKTIQSMERAADSLQSQNDALREEIELIGLSTEQQTLVLQQRNDVIILTKEATLAELERQSAITGTQTRVEIALASEIDALKERNALLGAKGVKNAAVDAAKSAADEWQKTTDSINQSLTDSLMRGFESGKDFAKNLRDTVINMFKTMVLRPVISAIVNPVAGAVTGMLGLSGPAQGGGNSVMGGIQTASNLNTLYGAGSQALFGGAAGASAASLGYANIVGMAGGDAIGALAAANGMWAGVATGAQAAAQAAIASNAAMAAGTAAALPAGTTAAAAGGGAAGASTGAMGALSAIPVWGWVAAAVLAAVAIFSKKSTPHTGAGAVYSEAGGLQEGAGIYNGQNFGMGMAEEYAKGTQEGVSTIAKGLTQTFDGIAKAFGKTAGYEIATAFADDSSKDGAWGSLRISKDGADLLNWNDTRESKWAPREFANGEDGYKEYLAEIAKDTRKVLIDMDLPSWADTMLESIGEAANMEQLSATLQQIGVIQTTFVQFGKTMEGFAGLTDKAFEALMRASGGFEALSANAGTYYENFYSEAEKTAAVTRSVSEALAQVGVAMPTTRDEFRALVESQLALGESGAEAVAALLGVSGAFASVVPAAADAAGAVEEMVSQITQNLLRDRGRLEADLLRAQGNTTGANAANRLLDISGYTEAETALYDYNAALRAQISGLEAASAASANALQRALDEVDSAYAALQRSVDAQRSLVQETINDTRAVFETLRDNVRSLYGEVGGAAAMQAAQGRAFIGQALSAAQATGYLPDGQQLQEAIGAVRSEMQSKVYASQAEADYQRLVLAGELKDLQDISGDQLTEAEKQLKALDDILDNARSQVDALKGIDTSVMSVEAAIQRLADALLEAKNPGLMDKYGMSAERLRELQGTYGDSINSAAGGTQYDKYKMYSAMLQDAAVGSVTFDEMRAVVESIAGAQTDADWKYLQQGSAGVEYASSIMPAIQETSAENKAGWYNNLAGVGLTDAQIRETVEAQLGAQTPEDWDYLKKLAGVPAFAVGTNYVPRDMLAQIHEGEAIVPKAYNPAAGGAGNSTARLEALVEGLTKEVQRLQAVVNDGNREQRRTANAVNGNPDMPMLVQTV